MVLPAIAAVRVYTLSLHDALPISSLHRDALRQTIVLVCDRGLRLDVRGDFQDVIQVLRHFTIIGFHLDALEARLCRSEEHTSELQSRRELVCRFLLEKKKISMSMF